MTLRLPHTCKSMTFCSDSHTRLVFLCIYTSIASCFTVQLRTRLCLPHCSYSIIFNFSVDEAHVRPSEDRKMQGTSLQGQEGFTCGLFISLSSGVMQYMCVRLEDGGYRGIWAILLNIFFWWGWFTTLLTGLVFSYLTWSNDNRELFLSYGPCAKRNEIFFPAWNSLPWNM